MQSGCREKGGSSLLKLQSLLDFSRSDTIRQTLWGLHFPASTVSGEDARWPQDWPEWAQYVIPMTTTPPCKQGLSQSFTLSHPYPVYSVPHNYFDTAGGTQNNSRTVPEFDSLVQEQNLVNPSCPELEKSGFTEFYTSLVRFLEKLYKVFIHEFCSITEQTCLLFKTKAYYRFYSQGAIFLKLKHNL